MRRLIATADLRLADVPNVDASLQDIVDFAYSFNGYNEWGSFQACAAIANARDHSTLVNLRTCLFFEARRWQHFARTPDENAQEYWRSLVSAIRARVQGQST